MAKKIEWPILRSTQHAATGKALWLVDASLRNKRERRYFKTKEAAESWQLQKNVERENHGAAIMNLPDTLRREAVELNDRLRLVGSTLTQAVEFYFKHGKPEGATKTVQEVVEEFLKSKSESGRNEAYLRVAGIMYGRFSKVFGDRAINTVMSKDISDWIASNPWAPVTRLNYQRGLSILWNFALKHGHAAHNPVKRLERPTLENKPPGILTVEETKKLLQRAVETKDDDMMLYLAIGAFAGLRVAEIERLDWREIDLRGKLIEVTAAKAKTRQRRHVTIAANLAEWLRLVPADRRTGQVIKGQVRVDRFAERAGVTEWPKNALRHSFVSFHLARHRDAAVTAGQAGHDQNMLFANYRELVKPGPATAYWKIRPSS